MLNAAFHIDPIEMDALTAGEGNHIRHRVGLPTFENEFGQDRHGQDDTVISKQDGNRRRRRTKRIHSRLSVRRIQAHLNRWLVRAKRNPRTAFAYAVGAFLAFLFIFSWLTLAIYYRLNKADTQGKSPLSLKDDPQNLPNYRGKLWPKKDIFTEMLVSRPSAILLPQFMVTGESIILPEDNWDDGYEGSQADYDGLEMDFLVEDGAKRNIYIDSYFGKNSFKEQRVQYFLGKDDADDFDQYYAYDDDQLRGRTTAYGKNDKIDDSKTCRRNRDYRLNLQNCNNIHEQELISSGIRFLGEGAYRQVFSIERFNGTDMEAMVVKDLRYDENVEYDNFEYVRMDALVAERLSSNERSFDIFGFCGLSILSQFFRHGDVEWLVVRGGGYAKDLHDEDELKPQNLFTPIQKLVIALEMAKGLVPLHGFKNSMIIHDDIQNSQYLFNDDKSMIILNDFNRAEFPLWDEERGEYCRYRNGRGHGNWRSPEEYANKPLTEKIDVWALGCNLYSVLTGLNPLYTIHSYKKYAQAILAGTLPTVDPRWKKRSKEERFLAEMIEKCFVWEPEDRPSVFEIVDFLQNAVDECLEPGQDTAKVIQSIEFPENSSDDETDDD